MQQVELLPMNECEGAFEQEFEKGRDYAQLCVSLIYHLQEQNGL